MRPATAHGKVLQAVRNGTLLRQPCEVCGAEKVDGHHEDYDRPLDVRWLCRKHHKELHVAPRVPVRNVRAEVTKDEWKAIRIRLIDERTTVGALVGRLLRDWLASDPKEAT